MSKIAEFVSDENKHQALDGYWVVFRRFALFGILVFIGMLLSTFNIPLIIVTLVTGASIGPLFALEYYLTIIRPTKNRIEQ